MGAGHRAAVRPVTPSEPAPPTPKEEALGRRVNALNRVCALTATSPGQLDAICEYGRACFEHGAASALEAAAARAAPRRRWRRRAG